EDERTAPGPDARTAEDDEESSVLPPLAKGDELTLRELKPEQKFTQPPPRYTEATLVSPAFDDILDVNYTRELEEDLDKIESGASSYAKTLTSFYKKFQKDLKRAE